MTSVFGSIMLQALYYFIVGALMLIFVGFLLRGFFWNYIKVRTSFGKLVMVKVRSRIRDFFIRGWIENGYLLYEVKNGFMDTSTIRIRIPSDANVFYRCLSVLWIDVDEEKHVLCKTDYSPVDGYDAIKFDNLLKRALQRPSINTGIEKLIILILVIVGVIVLVCAYFGYSSMAQVKILNANLPAMLKNMAGTVIGGGTV